MTDKGIKSILDTNGVDSFVPDLKDLMQLRGLEAGEAIRKRFGGVTGLCERLGTSPTNGLSGGPEEIKQRIKQYGINKIPPKSGRGLLRIFLSALLDITLIILVIAAIISIGVSYHNPRDRFYNDGPAADKSELTAGWMEGASILVAVAVIVIVTVIIDWWKERQRGGLQSSIEGEQTVSVVRNGRHVEIPNKDIVVGDVLLVKHGDLLSADGVVINSHDLRIDERSLTGERDVIRKGVGSDPMLLSGTHVMEGSARMLVTAVGASSQAGIMSTLFGTNKGGNEKLNRDHLQIGEMINAEIRNEVLIRPCCRKLITDNNKMNRKVDSDDEDCKGTRNSGLQARLATFALRVGYIGLVMAILTFFVLMLRFCIEEFKVHDMPWTGRYVLFFVHYFILAVTVLLVVVIEGLPVAVAIALAYSVKKMMMEKNLVRNLDACETLGNATTICTDKTGTLTTNRMTVVRSFINGKQYEPAPRYADLSPEYGKILVRSIAYNTGHTSRILPAEDGGLPRHVGNKTDCALLGFVENLGQDSEALRDKFSDDRICKVYTFNSVRKSMSTVVKINNGYRIYSKGASDKLLKKCSYICGSGGKIVKFTEHDREKMISQIIEPMACDGLRPICLAYVDYVRGSAEENEVSISHEPDWDNEKQILRGLTCLGIVGIEDPVREDVPEAVRKCQQAGITVRMITGDNINTARTVATKCGILQPSQDFLCVDRREFNSMVREGPGQPVNQSMMDNVWPRLRVLARSKPQDKFNLVKGITNGNQEVVAVTGSGTSDGPVLRRADVGIAKGSGSDVAKEASDIILTDDNFSGIVRAIVWARNVYDSIAKFLQFQLTASLVLVIVTFVGACAIRETPLRPIQMLWVNLIMDTFASIALGMEVPSEKIQNRKSFGKSLISCIMRKNIILHAIYQLVVILCLMFLGEKMFNIDQGRTKNYREPPTQHFTILFNVYVMMNLFNKINCRKIYGEHNVFERIYKNPAFIIIWIFTFICQILIVTFGGRWFCTKRLTISQWLWCILFGVGELLVAQIIALIPNSCSSNRRNIGPSESRAISNEYEHIDEARSSELWMRGANRLQKHQIEIKETFMSTNNRRVSSVASLRSAQEQLRRLSKLSKDMNLDDYEQNELKNLDKY